MKRAAFHHSAYAAFIMLMIAISKLLTGHAEGAAPAAVRVPAFSCLPGFHRSDAPTCTPPFPPGMAAGVGAPELHLGQPHTEG